MAEDALKISQDHVWVRLDEEGARLGISDFAAEALGKIIYVDLPEIGAEVKRGEPFAAVESGKAQVELSSPITGKVIKVNERLAEEPDLINQDCLGKGWIALLTTADTSALKGLMSKAEYDLFVAEAAEE
ncbi:MAG TPA: glycine cleavage system protein GcvH [Syntrophobacteria bacterium]|nr:glycine cleavage system protein GcvH [Syntrophobacteria bacterium]